MTTETKPPVPRVELDLQDPLPESDWTWRRALVFWAHAMQCGAIGYILFLMWKIANIMEGTDSVGGLIEVIDSLTKIAFWVVCIMALDRTLYLIAPSAEQATKMIQTVSALKEGIVFKKTQSVRATPEQTTAQTTSEAGGVPAITGQGISSSSGEYPSSGSDSSGNRLAFAEPRTGSIATIDDNSPAPDFLNAPTGTPPNERPGTGLGPKSQR